MIPDVELVPLPDSDRCCGGAGLYSMTQPELSTTLLTDKVDAIRATGADVLVTANPGCQLQIASGLRSAGLEVAVEHVLTLLDAALPSGTA